MTKCSPLANMSKLLIEEHKNKSNKEFKKVKENKDKERINYIHDKMYDLKQKKGKFKEKIKKSLMKESIYFIYNKSLTSTLLENNNEAIKRSLVDQFIIEENVDNLLRNFKKSSYLLAEYARIIEEYTEKFYNEAKETENFDYIIDNLDKKNFFDELDNKDVDDVADSIRDRVASSIDEFIQRNAEDKEKIKETLEKTKAKIEDTEKDSVKESYEILCKKRITDIREKRAKNLLESIIFNITKSTLKDEELKSIYMENGSINQDHIVNNCILTYAFLETLNTAKIEKFNEQYISNMLQNLKK